MKEKFDVTGMTCSACSSHVEKSVDKLDGIQKVSVNLLTNSMQVEFDERTTNPQTIIGVVEHAGYGASVQKSIRGQVPVEAKKEDKSIAHMKMRLMVSVIFLIPLMYVSMGHMIFSWFSIEQPGFTMNYLHGNQNAISYAFTQLLLLIPILFANQKYFKNGFKTLFNGSPNMDSLIAIGAGAAIAYGIFAVYKIGYGLGYGDMAIVEHYRHDLYFESAGTILTLITVGKYLETKSKGKTSEAITKLMNLAPKTVTVIRNDIECMIDVKEVELGDIFLVKPGESVAVDGVIEEGKSSFDESAITGESIPVLKQEGDKIISASINKSGLIRAKAVKVGEDTTIAQIIRLVEEASSSKAPIAKMADKIAGIFVPVVISIAVITGIIWLIAGAGFEFAMSSAIAVLVISCPCALGLATPVAIMVGTGKGAENGILIKSGEALEIAHMIDTVVLDKTGTITEGKPVVTDIDLFEGVEKESLLKIAGSIEKGSEHPLAEAIVNQCNADKIALTKVTEFNAVFGKGIVGVIEGTRYYAGNEKLMQENGIYMSESLKERIRNLSKQGKTPLLFANEKSIIGIISVADVVKKTSKEAVRQLKKYGIRVIMLTGDNEITANAIREQVGIDEVIAGVLPTQKEEKIAQLKVAGHKVAMVGDGINDAPALASADVGIAIGAGTDVAIESADIVLMKNDLLDAVGAITLSKAVIRNIKENLFWAFFYNCIGIPLAAGVLYPLFGLKLNPMFGAAAMSLSSICVVSNALRLKRVKLKDMKKDVKQHMNSTLEHSDEAQPEQEIQITEMKGSMQKEQSKNIVSQRKDGTKMKTITIMIEGMACGHCTGRVEKALKEITGVSEVTVSLEDKNAIVTAEDSVEAEILKNAVTEAGYEVVEIK